MQGIIRRLMENHRVNEFASPKNKVESKIDARSDTFYDHIMKCVIYKNTTNDLYHWLHAEVCALLEYASRLSVKTKSGKLKVSDYERLLFLNTAGDEFRDTNASLLGFKLDYVNREGYPDFDITPELMQELYDTTNEIKDIVCPMLAERTEYDQEDFYDKIKHLF